MAGSLDAVALRRAMEVYLGSLERHRDELNSLNVYPVPDGDTGTNMLLTQRSVVAALDGIGTEPVDGGGGGDELAALRERIARSSLMGARGNSGVILSQILRGLCERLPETPVGANDLAVALSHAAEQAWQAVARPVEGTVLTVIRDAARAATDAASHDGDPVRVIRAAAEEARASLARTTDLLPELRLAGVVDAGGKGVVLLLDALETAMSGVPVDEPIGPLGPVGQSDRFDQLEDEGMDFEVQYLLEAADPAVQGLRERLTGLGESVVMVGGGGLFNVHVHTDQPGRALEEGLSAGRPKDISIVYLPEQVHGCIAGQAREVRVAEQVTALVAVAEGAGLVRTFRSLGALVVPGGPGNNPAVSDLLAAVEAAPADMVVVLPNHPNVRAAAERAAEESGKQVRVIATRSVAAGLAAATAFHPGADLVDNIEVIDEAVDATTGGEMARAERDAAGPAGPIRAGAWMGVIDAEVVCSGPAVVDVAVNLAGRLGADRGEVLTLVIGDDAAASDAESVERALRQWFPHLRVDVVEGGQPRYPFLLGVE